MLLCKSNSSKFCEEIIRLNLVDKFFFSEAHKQFNTVRKDKYRDVINLTQERTLSKYSTGPQGPKCVWEKEGEQKELRNCLVSSVGSSISNKRLRVCLIFKHLHASRPVMEIFTKPEDLYKPPPSLHLRCPVYIHEWFVSLAFLLWWCQTAIFFRLKAKCTIPSLIINKIVLPHLFQD